MSMSWYVVIARRKKLYAGTLPHQHELYETTPYFNQKHKFHFPQEIDPAQGVRCDNLTWLWLGSALHDLALNLWPTSSQPMVAKTKLQWLIMLKLVFHCFPFGVLRDKRHAYSIITRISRVRVGLGLCSRWNSLNYGIQSIVTIRASLFSFLYS